MGGQRRTAGEIRLLGTVEEGNGAMARAGPGGCREGSETYIQEQDGVRFVKEKLLSACPFEHARTCRTERSSARDRQSKDAHAVENLAMPGRV
jgi:hypothetical protein